MSKHFLFFCFIALILLGCEPETQNHTPNIQDLTSDWSFKSLHDTTFRKATVPGNVFTDLLDNKLIQDPFIKNNEEKVQWVSDSSWTYQSAFQIDEKILQRNHIEINFEGLDTYAKVYLNDSLILTANNAFRKYSTDIKSISKKENKPEVFSMLMIWWKR